MGSGHLYYIWQEGRDPDFFTSHDKAMRVAKMLREEGRHVRLYRLDQERVVLDG